VGRWGDSGDREVERSNTGTLMLDILTQLNLYCPSDTSEAKMVAATIAFIEQNADCFWRSNLSGHVTGSAWIIDETHSFTLLTHHQKLDRWLQLGGHTDGDRNVFRAALREAREESGLKSLKPLQQQIFDVDIHLIPEHKGTPPHYHYDIRYLLEADKSDRVSVSSESKSLAWISIAEVEKLNADESIARMVRKSQKRLGNN
jgi:8-oxo-dGTP pyrophosphatase MutT (NUDIX family)